MSDFVQRVRKSRLVDDDKLRAVLAQLGNQPWDPRQVGRLLIRNSLLTKWQCQQILDGRYKGFVLGKYKLLDQLGRGGMSMVYVAEHVGMLRKVALKVLPKSRAHDDSFVERFRREARASAALNHPNIVRAFDFDCQDDTYYLVMELVDGQNLRELVAAEHPMPFPRIVRLIAEAARGLQHAHDRGFVHRDIKPANILVDQADHVRILDLGLAMWADPDQSSMTLQNHQLVLGTADYLAPEQALNSHAVDQRADIYSLGGTLYHSLTGQPPYPAGSIAQKIAQHQSAAPPDPRSLRTDCPAALAGLCLQMMQKSPDARINSAAEVAERLEACLADRHATSPDSATDFDWSQLGGRQSAGESLDEDPTQQQFGGDAPPTAAQSVRIAAARDPVIRLQEPTSTGKRRRRGVPWWLWLSMLGLLLAAGWMWQQMPRTP